MRQSAMRISPIQLLAAAILLALLLVPLTGRADPYGTGGSDTGWHPANANHTYLLGTNIRRLRLADNCGRGHDAPCFNDCHDKDLREPVYIGNRREV